MPSYAWAAGTVCLLLAAALFLMLILVLVRTARLTRARRPLPSALPPADPKAAHHAAESLSCALRFKTLARETGQDGEMNEFVRMRDYLKSRYPLTHEKLQVTVAGGYSLLYRWSCEQPIGEPVLFCGHMDVLAAEGTWEHPPFGGLVEQDCVWGRGALSGKNNVICLLETVERLLSQGFVPVRELYLAFSHDREAGGAEGAAAISRIFAKQDLRFYMILDQGGSLARVLPGQTRPLAEVGVAEKGAMTLRLTAQSESRPVFAPQPGSAAVMMAEALCRLEVCRRKSKLTPLVRAYLKELGPELPYRWRMKIANLWLFKNSLFTEMERYPWLEALVRSTVAISALRVPSACGVTPGQAQATVNVYVLPGETCAEMTSYIRDLTADLGVAAETLRADNPAKPTEYSDEAFHCLRMSIQAVFGHLRVTPTLLAERTDAWRYERYSRHVFRFCPFGLTPREFERLYGADEGVRIEALGQAVAFYRDLMVRLAGNEEEERAL